MTEADKPARRTIESLAQAELGEMITVGSELFDQLFARAEQQGPMQVGGARITAERWTGGSQKYEGHENDRVYDDQELNILFSRASDDASSFTVRKFPPDRVATWRVSALHTERSHPLGITYAIDQLKEEHRPEGNPAGYKISFTQSYDKPSFLRYQKNLQTLRTLNVDAKALPK